MPKVVKGPIGGGRTTAGNQASSGLGDLLNGLMSGGGLGSILGAGVGAGAGSQMGGGLGSILGGSLGAMLPTLLPAVLGMLGGMGQTNQTGLHQLVDNMHANGLGGVAQSWVGTGPNQSITGEQVQQVLTPDQLAELSAKSGLSQEQVKAGVAAILPDAVNHLTPGGAVPQPQQVQNTTNQLQRLLAGVTAGRP